MDFIHSSEQTSSQTGRISALITQQNWELHLQKKGEHFSCSVMGRLSYVSWLDRLCQH